MPAKIQRLHGHIWRSLFGVARGELSAKEALESLTQSTDIEQILKSLSEQEQDFFFIQEPEHTLFTNELAAAYNTLSSANIPAKMIKTKRTSCGVDEEMDHQNEDGSLAFSNTDEVTPERHHSESRAKTTKAISGDDDQEMANSTVNEAVAERSSNSPIAPSESSLADSNQGLSNASTIAESSNAAAEQQCTKGKKKADSENPVPLRQSARCQEQAAAKNKHEVESEDSNQPRPSKKPKLGRRTKPTRPKAVGTAEPSVWINRARYFAAPITVEPADVTLSPKEVKRLQGCEIHTVNSRQMPVHFSPESHFQEHLKVFEDVNAYIKSKPGKDGKPSYSSIHFVTRERFEAATVQEIQKILRTHHIAVAPPQALISGRIRFDISGFQFLEKCQNSIISIQDQSVPIPNHDYGVQQKSGTVAHLLAASLNPKGPILNALDFPMNSGMMYSTYQSDWAAWINTVGQGFCLKGEQYPTTDMKWGLAGMKGARSWWHVDTEGVCTEVTIKCGAKWWVLACPRKDTPAFNSTEIFEDFQVDTPATEKWDMEAVYLEEGSTLLMRPNTPHLVYGPENTISAGSHFYAISTIQQTIPGIVHCLFQSNLVTNTEHPRIHVLPRRMLLFCYLEFVSNPKYTPLSPDYQSAGHLPDLSNQDGINDILALCCLAILANALDPRTYQYPLEVNTDAARARWLEHDVNVIETKERQHMAFTRGIAIQVLNWLIISFQPAGCDPGNSREQAMKQYVNTFMFAHAAGIINYAKFVEQKKIEVAGLEVSVATVRNQINGAMNCVPALTWDGDKDVPEEHKIIGYTSEKTGFIYNSSSAITRYNPAKEEDVAFLTTQGQTPGDLAYFTGEEMGWPTLKRMASK